MTVKTRDVRPATARQEQDRKNKAIADFNGENAPPAPVTLAESVKPATETIAMSGGRTMEFSGPAGDKIKSADARDGIGGNNPPADIVLEIQERLPVSYAALELELSLALDIARTLPKEITTQDEATATAKSQTDIRGIRKKIKIAHQGEKAPFLRAGQFVDGFFKGMDDQGGRADGVLQERSNLWVRRVAEIARQEREAAAEDERARADLLRGQAEQAKRLADAAEAARIAAEEKAAASRRQTVHDKAEEKTATADAALAAAAELQRQADAAERTADRAELATGARAADLVRSRAGGVTMSARTQWVVAVDDVNLVPLELIRAYLPRAEIEKAVKTWAKLNGYKGLTMAGVRIFEEEIANNR